MADTKKVKISAKEYINVGRDIFNKKPELIEILNEYRKQVVIKVDNLSKEDYLANAINYTNVKHRRTVDQNELMFLCGYIFVHLLTKENEG